MFLIEVEANTGNDTGIRMSKPALSFRVVSIAAGSILGKIADEHVMGAIVGNMRNSFIETKVKSSNVIGPLGRSAPRARPGGFIGQVGWCSGDRRKVCHPREFRLPIGHPYSSHHIGDWNA
jgi:hypothetical protein